MKKRSALFIALAVLVTVFIFINSLHTARESIMQSGVFVRYLEYLMSLINISVSREVLSSLIRKGAHVTEFFVQGLFISLAFLSEKGRFKRYIIYILFFGLMTGCIDEFLQSFSDGRGSMVSDIFIDFAGTCLSCIVVGIVYKLRKKTD